MCLNAAFTLTHLQSFTICKLLCLVSLCLALNPITCNLTTLSCCRVDCYVARFRGILGKERDKLVVMLLSYKQSRWIIYLYV
jgi:hypothetical protein